MASAGVWMILIILEIYVSLMQETITPTHIWQKSARMGWILTLCHNVEIFRSLVFLDWSLWKGHLVVPGHKCQRESKQIVHTS